MIALACLLVIFRLNSSLLGIGNRLCSLAVRMHTPRVGRERESEKGRGRKGEKEKEKECCTAARCNVGLARLPFQCT